MSLRRRGHMDAAVSSDSTDAGASTGSLLSSLLLTPRQSTSFIAAPPAHQDYGPQINFTIWLLTALSFLFLALRIYCKALRGRGLWWDDHILTAAWLTLAVECSFLSVTITLGMGRPLSEFNPDHLDMFLLFSNLAGTTAILAATWSKTSFAVTVLRISNGWIKRLVWFIIVSVNVALGLSVAFTWGQCTPIEKTWRPSLPGQCWPKFYVIRYNIFTAAYSGAMDIVLAIIPWKVIWSLTMNKKEKFGVLFAMSMGILGTDWPRSSSAGATSIAKITTLPGIGDSNFTDATTQLTILGVAESAITIIAASIPILRALLHDGKGPGGVITTPGPSTMYANSRRYELSSRLAPSSSSSSAGGRGGGNTRVSLAMTTRSRMSTDFDVGKPKGRMSRLSFKAMMLEEAGYEKEDMEVGRAM